MSKYANFDELLLQKIGGGCRQYDGLVRATAEEAKQLAWTSDYWRVADRRLQALRKAGKIAYDKSRQSWYLTEND